MKLPSLECKSHDVDKWLSALGLPSADRDYKPGHQRVLALIAALEKVGLHFRRPKLRVRIAGTNGKGSTAHFLAAALQANGLKVGLYTSPHILQFHERICVQGVAISHAALLSLMQQVMPLALETEVSYFEAATVLALLQFSMEEVDVEILEAGVGAKLDATTAVPADIGLLTSVALDHESWLGDSLKDIALEKSYVFDGCKVALTVFQADEVQAVLAHQYANLQYAELFPKPLAMLGAYQQSNAGLALSAVQSIQSIDCAIKPCIDLNVCIKVMREKHIDGRLQNIVYQGHNFWLDAAHNEHAVHHIVTTLASLKQQLDVIFLCTREDRDLSSMVTLLQPYAHKVIKMTGGEEYVYTNVAAALSAEVSQYNKGKFLILGSFVTLGETLRWINK